MGAIRGSISSRLRAMLKRGEITPNDMTPVRQPDPPKTSSVRHGEGHGLGKGATRKRSGGGAS